MSGADWGAILTIMLGLGAWAISAEIRIQRIKARLSLTEQDKKDLEAWTSIRSMSDDELDAALLHRIRSKPKP